MMLSRAPTARLCAAATPFTAFRTSAAFAVGLRSTSIASFHTSIARRSEAATAAEPAHKSKLHGSYHWNAERALSVLTVPLIGTAFFAGPSPSSILLSDYIPHRKFGILSTVATWTLRVATGVLLYGLFMFNTNDVGVTAFVKRLWTGKL
ncbi:hypothetical protein BC829DRAFT_382033 [Chytridium lagenaria]|nr:hypothetical protein BC829DRAFT_382033 [Chytridium lagenaria]